MKTSLRLLHIFVRSAAFRFNLPPFRFFRPHQFRITKLFLIFAARTRPAAEVKGAEAHKAHTTSAAHKTQVTGTKEYRRHRLGNGRHRHKDTDTRTPTHICDEIN